MVDAVQAVDVCERCRDSAYGFPDEHPEPHSMDACKELRDRLIEEGELPASHHSVNLLKCNGSLGIRANSGDVSCPICPLESY